MSEPALRPEPVARTALALAGLPAGGVAGMAAFGWAAGASPGFVAELAVNASVPLVVAVGLLGAMAVIGHRIAAAVAPGALRRAPASLALCASFCLGATLVSLLLLTLGALGMLDLLPVRFLQLVAVGATTWGVVAHRERIVGALSSVRGVGYAAWLLVAAVVGFRMAALSVLPGIHPDAVQYHVGIPRAMAVAGGIVGEKSLLHGGTYIGYDILNLLPTDLAALPDSLVSGTRGLVLFSLCSGLLLPLSVFALARVLGASGTLASLGAAAVFTTSSIGRWGSAKNDVVAAAVAIVAATLLLCVIRRPEVRPGVLAGLVTGFAISVKITMAVPLLVLCAVLVVVALRRHRAATLLAVALPVLAVVGPWILRAWVLSGEPLYPVMTDWTPAMLEAWAQRDANGLALSASQVVGRWPDLMLDRYEVSGNDSVGMLAFVSILAASAVFATRLLRRRFGPGEAVMLAALTWMAVFTIRSFEGRFLTRYLLFSVGVVFAYLAARLAMASEQLPPRPSVAVEAAILVVLVLGLASTDHVHAVRDVANSPELAAMVEGGDQDAAALQMLSERLSTGIFGEANRLASGYPVVVNDHMIMLVDGPVVNLHPLHSAVWDWENLTGAELAADLSNRGVRAAVLRGGFDSYVPALQEVLVECGERLDADDQVELWRIDPDCEVPA